MSNTKNTDTSPEEGYVFQGNPEDIQVEEAVQEEANKIGFDAYKLASILLTIGQKMTGITLYEYQLAPTFRIIYSMLVNDGAEITILYPRQSGKSEVVSIVSVVIGVLFPVLARIYPKELFHFSKGVKMGLLAPQYDQVETVYGRCVDRLLSDPVQQFMSDPDIGDASTSKAKFKTKSGSTLTPQSAAKQSKVESKTYHIIFLDESQDLDTDKVRRCVSSDMIAYTPQGEKTIDEVVKHKLDVFHPQYGFVTPKNWFDNGKQEVVKLTLENGFEIETTLNHKNRVIRRGRKDNKPFNLETENLTIGDRLSIADKLPYVFGGCSYNDGLLAGYLLGDGTIKKGASPRLYCFNDTYNRLTDIVREYECDTIIRRENDNNGLLEVAIVGNTYKDSGFRTNSKGSNKVIELLRDLGIYGLSGKDKTINIEHKSKRFLVGLIEGLIETDGSVVLPKNGLKGHIAFNNISFKLVKTIQKACHILGIHGNICSYDNNGTLSGNLEKMHAFVIKDVRSIRQFYMTISLHTKQSKLVELVNRIEHISSRNSCKLYNEWERFYKIISIERIGEKDTYCVEMPTDDHLWVVNGIITHNSIIPMTASTFGTIVRTGTPGRYKGDFYYTINNNIKHDSKLRTKRDRETKQLHFQYTYKDVIKHKNNQFKIDGINFHKMYEKAVLRDRDSMGENSEAFRMAYNSEWLLDVGMFITEKDIELKLLNRRRGFPRFDGDEFIVAGLDIASARAQTVLTYGSVDEPAFEIGEHPHKIVGGWLALDNMNYEEQFQIIAQTIIDKKIRVLYADYTGVGRALTDTLIYHIGHIVEIVPYNFSIGSKSDMWKALDEDTDNGKIEVPASKVVAETQEFQDFYEQMVNLQKYWRGSYLTCEKTQGFKDDYCDSFGLFNLAGNHIHVPIEEATVEDNIFFDGTNRAMNIKDNSGW